jgi:DNA-binding transcriptional LysR family regulator
VVAAAAELRANIGAEHAISGRVVLGVVEAVALTWLDEVLREVEARLPNVSLEIEVDVSHDLVGRGAAAQGPALSGGPNSIP